MKKKIFIITILIFVVLGILYFIDMNRTNDSVKENEPEDTFELIFNQRNDLETKTIISEDETDKYDYSIYSYGGDVQVKIDNKKYDLREALLNDKIRMDKIIEKANKDSQEKRIRGDLYSDGGTKIYMYDTYTIIKFNTLEGNKDVYIGNTTMEYDVYKSQEV